MLDIVGYIQLKLKLLFIGNCLSRLKGYETDRKLHVSLLSSLSERKYIQCWLLCPVCVCVCMCVNTNVHV